MAAWKNPENFALWLLVVSVFIITLISAFVYFTRLYFMRLLEEQEKLQATIVAHQQQLLEDSILVQERERTRIAADLHDVLISKLNISLLTLTTTQNIEQSTELIQSSIKLARGISHDLSPPMIEQSTLIELMEEFLVPLKEQYKITTQMEANRPYELPMQIKLQSFRICQEIFNNILKHAKATALDILIHHTNDYLQIKISDNGVGFEKEKVKHGLGLKNIKLRSEVIGGEFDFDSTPNQGTSFSFRLNFPLS